MAFPLCPGPSPGTGHVFPDLPWAVVHTGCIVQGVAGELKNCWICWILQSSVAHVFSDWCFLFPHGWEIFIRNHSFLLCRLPDPVAPVWHLDFFHIFYSIFLDADIAFDQGNRIRISKEKEKWSLATGVELTMKMVWFLTLDLMSLINFLNRCVRLKRTCCKLR